MANGYKVRVVSAVSDGTNYYFEVEITSPTQTYPLVRPVFKVGTSVAAIISYIQTIANNAPALATDISTLVGQSVSG